LGFEFRASSLLGRCSSLLEPFHEPLFTLSKSDFLTWRGQEWELKAILARCWRLTPAIL
jgi:hypothetical protein